MPAPKSISLFLIFWFPDTINASIEAFCGQFPLKGWERTICGPTPVAVYLSEGFHHHSAVWVLSINVSLMCPSFFIFQTWAATVFWKLRFLMLPTSQTLPLPSHASREYPHSQPPFSWSGPHSIPLPTVGGCWNSHPVPTIFLLKIPSEALQASQKLYTLAWTERPLLVAPLHAPLDSGVYLSPPNVPPLNFSTD